MVKELPENPYRNHPGIIKLREVLQNRNLSGFHLGGLAGSSVSFVASALTDLKIKHQLFILTDKEEAAYFFNDMENICPGNRLFFFPSSWKRLTGNRQKDPAGLIQRTELLDELSKSDEPVMIVTYPEALSEKVITGALLKKLRLVINKGESLSMDFVAELLVHYGFRETDFVYEPGEFAIRGSIIDLFSYSSDRPYRIDFFGDEVESIRLFDIETQLSEGTVESATVIPDIDAQTSEIQTCHKNSLLTLLKDGGLVWIKDLEFTRAKMDEIACLKDLSKKPCDSPHMKEHPFACGNDLLRGIENFSVLEFGQSAYLEKREMIYFNTVPQPAFNKNFELLAVTLAGNAEKEYTNYIFSGNVKQFERLSEIFREIYGNVPFVPVNSTISQGFTDNDLQISCFTDHQIFERYHKFRLRESFKRKESVSLKTINELQPGDYVVHIDHGIGRFGGLEKIDVRGKKQEALKLVFRGGDTLYVSIHSLHRISKYKGKDGVPPKINKLGSAAWQKLKQRTSNKVKDIARELIALYARRRHEKGYRFSADSYLQRELEASFIYEDTPDQVKASNMVKEQMESSVPMDMLVCGDVGFGKTEVAIRAAFKAVSDSKQVAVLVPTTILALQHYTTFKERLKDFPCTVEHLSRLRSAGKQKQIIDDLGTGRIDIVIGTHRILGKDIRFKDMGLLIIDEEQKFGVSVKEKLKRLKLNVDTLTLTATPIPRTLQFSLMGARDLAIINTPPPNRHPIVTELHQFNKEIIGRAIVYEVQRGGQVFFIHNRIDNIAEIELIIQKECPGIKTVVAHGQMEGKKLESIMLGFISGEYDVLVATTIIESGLDIPNANTIIINNAHHFGLSDLHQLRGRVGRSNKKAFCYLLAPPPQAMTKEARQRLKAVEDFSELGSGFNIAMQDLDIRGAGNLLGREQSGFIADIGFETYHKILDEAVRELRETEFSHLLSDHKTTVKGGSPYLNDCIVDTDLELLFPEEYVPGNRERIRLYRILDNTVNEQSLQNFEKDLIDRFGPVPEQTRELLNIVRLRRSAISLGFEKITLKNRKMTALFITNQQSPYYQSPIFSVILENLQKQRRMKMKEENGKLRLTIPDINSVEEALQILNSLYPSQVQPGARSDNPT